jgi:sugar O-acyltransferase (sialic acid O-acetyltransferase NeuD family)
MNDLLLFPFGGTAREALLAVLEQNTVKKTWNVLGFVDDDKSLWGKTLCGVEVLGGREVFSHFPSAQVLAVPGNPQTFLGRDEIIAGLSLSEDRFATIIDPRARMAPDSKIGTNTLVMANAIISASVVIGKHCAVLPNTVIAHESRIEDYTLVGANVIVSGFCTIGRSCYIGSGSSIRDHVTINAQSLVGIGSCVLKDVPEKAVVLGNPARFLRNVEGTLFA